MTQSLQPAIGFLGGTFDPIHFGHLRPALEIQESLNLSTLYLMPNYLSPHKSSTLATAQQRLRMVELATQSTPQLAIDNQEILQTGPSYTIDTLKRLRAQHPTTPLCFIMGMDALLQFDKWHQYQEILNYCHLVVSYRPGAAPQFNDTVKALLAQHQVAEPSHLHDTLCGAIYLQNTTQLAISSSQIRRLVAAQQRIDFLTPSAVCHYIQQQGCYQTLKSDK